MMEILGGSADEPDRAASRCADRQFAAEAETGRL
jgi:hypothetical protein